MYQLGFGLPKDASQARHWLEIAAKLHSVPAKYDLALMLLQEPDAVNRDRAFQLLRESAAGGVVAAKHQLGLEILHRPDLARTSNEAVTLLEEAASDGFWKSSVVLGILSRDGIQMERDSKTAYFHFRVSALQGSEKASALVANDLRKLSLELGQTQIQAIDQQADEWVQKHSRPLEFVDMPAEKGSMFPAYALQYPAKDIHAGLLLGSPEADVGGIPDIGEPSPMYGLNMRGRN